jgi:hypothetical protein
MSAEKSIKNPRSLRTIRAIVYTETPVTRAGFRTRRNAFLNLFEKIVLSPYAKDSNFFELADVSTLFAIG